MAVGESLLDWVRQVQKCRSDQYIIARKFRLTLNMLKLVVYNKKNNLSSQIDYPEEHSFLDECKVGDKLDCGQLARMHKALEKELHSMKANVHMSETWFVKVVQHMVDLNSCNILWLLIDCYPIDRMPDENEKRKMINAACQREVTTHFDPNDPWIMLRLIAMDSSSLIPTLNEIMPLATWELKQFILNVMLNQQRPEIIEFLPLFIEAQQRGDAIAMALISFDLDEITPHVLSCKIENVGRLIHWFELQVSYVLDEKNAVHIRQKLNKLNHMLVNHPLTSKDMVLTIAEQTWGEFTDILYDVLDILSKTYSECFQIEKKTFIKEINFIKEYTFINVGKRMDYFFRQMLGDQTYVAWKRLICFSECSWINQRNSSNVLSLLNDQLMVLKYHVKESNMSIGIVAFSEKGAQFKCLIRSARVIELICNVNNWAYTLSCMKKIADLDCSKHDCFKYELSGSVLTELRLNVNDPSLELIIEMIYETLAKGLHFQLKDARDILNGYKDILPFDVDELLIRLVVHSNDIFSCLNVMNEMEHSPLIRSKNLFYIDALYSNGNDDAPVSGIVFQRWIYEQQATFRVFESKKDLNLFLNQFILFVCNHKQFGIIKYVINERLIPRLLKSKIIHCCTKEEIDKIKCRINIVLTNYGENTIEDIEAVYDALDLFIAEDIPKEVNVKKLAGWVVDRINNYSETQQEIFRTLKPFSCVIKSEKASIPHQYYITEFNQFKYAIYVMLGQNIEVPDHLLDSLVIRLMIAGIGLEMLYQGISPWFLAEDIIQWLKKCIGMKVNYMT